MKITLLVIDSFGIGAAKDAKLYGDEDSNTYLSISKYVKIPTLISLGLNNIDKINLEQIKNPIGAFARLEEKSLGKDTITGHWEIAGVITSKANPTYPNGFPNEIIKRLEKEWNVGILGNIAASGTEIIKDLGDLHIKTGKPIVYTSADSVLQIAAHTSVIPLEQLYKFCEIAREIMSGEHNVGRIIARPFLTTENGFKRTEDRKDFAVKIPKNNLLTKLQSNNINVYGYGKIYSIFNGEGIYKNMGGHSNDDVFDALFDSYKNIDNGLLFINLVDTDMLYGHRNDVKGYAECMNKIDVNLKKFINIMSNKDYLIVTADHGCDPSNISTDHSREDVPLLIYNKNTPPQNLGIIKGFDYISNFILSKFNLL